MNLSSASANFFQYQKGPVAFQVTICKLGFSLLNLLLVQNFFDQNKNYFVVKYIISLNFHFFVPLYLFDCDYLYFVVIIAIISFLLLFTLSLPFLSKIYLKIHLFTSIKDHFNQFFCFCFVSALFPFLPILKFFFLCFHFKSRKCIFTVRKLSDFCHMQNG